MSLRLRSSLNLLLSNKPLLLRSSVRIGCNKNAIFVVNTREFSDLKSKFKSYDMDSLKPKLIYGSAGIVVFYGISRLMYDLTFSFMSLTPAVSLYYGFIGGVLSTGAMSGLAYTGVRAIHIHPQEVYWPSWNLVSSNAQVKDLLGNVLKVSSDLRAYKSVKGGITVKNKSLSWVNPECILVYNIIGDRGIEEGMVTVKGIKRNNKIEIVFIGVDVGFKDRIVILGNESEFLTNEQTMLPHKIIRSSKDQFSRI